MDIESLKKTYPIQTGLNNPILRTKSVDVEKISAEIKEFADILVKLMYEYDGVGLAAPQIGRNIRMIAITQWDIRKDKWKLKYEKVLINPQITYFSKQTEIDEEGCLSLPRFRGLVERPKEIHLQYIDLNGKKQYLNASGINARIVQHEIDHLDGILFADKVIKKEFDIKDIL